ncbi:DinB family protein [Actinomadura rupiterrae]|uniref:DinB family protein n=1 Tax=Actinomadura rupiterrae TaxID=559627 RepID=UPI0020A4DA5E|nr:DinB family protein [Actinomadura rupiterrae]MCP2340733.1 putative damage-inducible protein DinB [Actinomadura rupiterrae]
MDGTGARAADERATLISLLEAQRDALAMVCAGLSDAEMADPSVPPSTLTLGGLVGHMAEVERAWFRRVFAGEDVPLRWSRFPGDDFGFDGPAEDAYDAWYGECARAREVVASAPSLDASGRHPRRGAVSLRWILCHMIEEYARHNGHAEVLRAAIDGRAVTVDR